MEGCLDYFSLTGGLFARILPSEWSHLFGIHALIVRSVAWSCVSYLSFWSVSRDCFRFCRRPDPLVIIEQLVVGSFFPERVLRKNRYSSGRSPVAHLNVRTSGTLNIRLLCPAPANATIASKCSCLSLKGPAHMGAGLTSRSDATPALPRRCSLMALRASLYSQCCARCCACGSSAHKTFHGLVDRTSGREDTISLSTLFFDLRLHVFLFCVLLTGVVVDLEFLPLRSCTHPRLLRQFGLSWRPSSEEGFSSVSLCLTLLPAIGSLRLRDFGRRLCLLFDLCRLLFCLVPTFSSPWRRRICRSS